MSLSEESKTKIRMQLQYLIDEGWDGGMAYALIQDGPEGVKEQFWIDDETRANRLIEEAMAYIVFELTGEDIRDEEIINRDEDTTD